ncbi:MAG: transcriptional repressor [Saprospirales bacterium]|nr:transcriptional repressor [Saprospirales bacterium]
MSQLLEQKLLSRKVKPTAVRMLVLQQLMDRASAISLSELENNFERADRSTLYRTLKTFEKSKLIHRIDDGTGMSKYALCEDGCECKLNDLHVHFYCTTCQQTICVTEAKVPKVELPSGFELTEMNMVLKGICANCKK